MDKIEIWNKCLKMIKKEVGKGIFDLWFKPVNVKHIQDQHIVLEIPDRFYKEWIEENYNELIIKTLKDITGIDFSIKYDVIKKQISKQNSLYLQERKKALRQRKVYLNPRYTFEEFVVGPSNQFAHAAALKVSESPGTLYNPLFIYGGVGLGKTHLISAIGWRVIDNISSLKVLYVQSEQFTNEVVSAVRHDKMSELKEKYRNTDLLLIDDIQFIANKTQTQEEFFHTFNVLYDQQKQIVISSDRPPREIQDITDRLKSRFTMGLIADIQPPSVETKIAILQKKASYLNIAIPDEVLQFLAIKVKTNIRELEGCLLKLAAHASLSGIPISLDMAKIVLKDMIEEDMPITIDKITKIVADFYGIKIQDMKSKKRTKEIAIARQVAMYICRQLTELSLGDIGKGFGGKDHTTVIYACRQVEKKLSLDESFNKTLKLLINKLNS